MMTAMYPSSQGIGGSTGGYTIDNGAAIRLRTPANDGYVYYPHLDCGNKVMKVTFAAKTLTLSGRIANNGRTTYEVSFWLEAKNVATGQITKIGQTPANLKPGYGWNSWDYPLSKLGAGTYECRIKYKSTNEPADREFRFSGLQQNFARVVIGTDGNITSAVIPLRDNISVTGVDFNTPLYAGKMFRSTIHVHSDARQVMMGYIAPCFYSATTNAPVYMGQPLPADEVLADAGTPPAGRVGETGQLLCDVYPGDNDYDYTATVPDAITAGNYYLQLEEVIGQSRNGDTIHVPISSRLPVTVNPAPADPDLCCLADGDYQQNSFTVVNSQNVDWNGITINYSVKNKSGVYLDQLKFNFSEYTTTAAGTSSYVHKGSYFTEMISIGPGETIHGTFTFKYPEGQPNTKYRIFPYGNEINPSTGKTSWKQLAYNTDFKSGTVTGVEDVINDSPVVDSEWYDLQGRRLRTQPEHGVSIRRDHHLDGTVTTTRVAR